MADEQVLPISDRPFDVVYRGRPLPFHLGRHAQLKAELSHAGGIAAKKLGLRSDVGYREEDRLYGRDWENFLKSGKSTLGCEGGAEIFDFDGKIELKSNSFVDADQGVTYDDVKSHILKFYEYNVTHKTVTPRIFEAALLGTPMLLVRGRYSTALEPDNHYIPIEPSLRNLLKVMSTVKTEPDRLQEMAIRARDHVLANPEFPFEYYVEKLDMVLSAIK